MEKLSDLHSYRSVLGTEERKLIIAHIYIYLFLNLQ